MRGWQTYSYQYISCLLKSIEAKLIKKPEINSNIIIIWIWLTWKWWGILWVLCCVIYGHCCCNEEILKKYLWWKSDRLCSYCCCFSGFLTNTLTAYSVILCCESETHVQILQKWSQYTQNRFIDYFVHCPQCERKATEWSTTTYPDIRLKWISAILYQQLCVVMRGEDFKHWRPPSSASQQALNRGRCETGWG